MFQNSGTIVGMATSRSCTAGFTLLMWLCWAPLLIAAYDPITSPNEVKALQDIKRSLVDVNGNLSNWNQGDPCTSTWTGVWCFNTTLDDGYLHVSELRLLNMNLSGTLSPSLGDLSHLKILDFMWNKISGQIPKQIGDIKSLELLLLNGNQLTGPLPEELGYLPYLDRIQIDQNQISGPIPNSFAFLNATQHFHMNNNSLSGQIPPELYRLPSLMHLLLDNNNLSGFLPPQFSQMPNLRVLQLDNNKFDGAVIPTSYASMTKLVKLSLRNCSLQGPIPDFSGIPELAYLDLSSNQLNESIPSNKLSQNTTTIILSDNNLSGPIPVYFSGLPRLQKLSLANNSLSGSVPSIIWQNRILNGSERLILHFENNKLTNISGNASLPQNVTLWLQGNPACSNLSLVQFCGSPSGDVNNGNDNNSTSPSSCYVQSCPAPYEYSPTSPTPCFCAAPLIIDYRLKSPGFSDFRPYETMFKEYLTSSLSLYFYQLYIESFTWQEGPRLAMDLKFYPTYDASTSSNRFNSSEVRRILSSFTGWKFQDNNLFGPYELLSITLSSVYEDVITFSQTSGISKGALAGIILGAIAGAIMLSAIVSLLILRLHPRSYKTISRRRQVSKASIRIDGVKDFTYAEMASATQNFNSSSQIGEGGYGRVYKGILVDGTLVAIKRAQEGSLQGEREFLTEIELLSRLHHRNLVSLIGYCDDEGEQMLVYEFMSNGTVRDKLSAKAKVPLSFASRLRIALGSAKGILYLHTEADPPIFHRDIKTSNLLLDSNFNAKVADFGLSKLAPVPDTEGRTPAHVSTVVRGTPGYVDPEYYLTQKLTDKSDVYSLGVVFLEMLTGMQPIMHGKNIVREVKDAFQAGEIFSIIDERMGSYASDSVQKFLDLAMKCCQQETDARPSMAEIVGILERIWQTLPDNDPGVLDKVTNGTERATNSGSSSSTGMRVPYLSLDVSGSNLKSGTIPVITPR